MYQDSRIWFRWEGGYSSRLSVLTAETLHPGRPEVLALPVLLTGSSA